MYTLLMELLERQQPFPQTAALKRLSQAIIAAGGKPLVVGGAVRDHFLGKTPKDIDIEVYGLDFDSLEKTLKAVGTVHAVGKSFGVLKVALDEGNSAVFDVSLPRRENKIAKGHRGFIVTTETHLEYKEAASRRDFTINAIAWDMVNQTFIDPYHGISDLENKILRHVSDAFIEDPLRVLRACQFVARFSLDIAPATLQLCKNLKDELYSLPVERIFEELKKMLLAQNPSLGFSAMKEMGALTLFSELEALIGCQQDPEWHPEGDVWVHTLMVLDQAARIVRRENLEEQEALIVMLGALCHDLGKPATTQMEKGRWRSKMHESAGKAPTQNLLCKIGVPPFIIEAVVPLVAEHLKPHQLYRERDTVSDTAIRRLSTRAPIYPLCLVSEADSLGRTTPDALRGEELASPWLLKKAQELAVHQAPPEAILKGRDLLKQGIQPGPQMGRILKAAYEEQLEGNIQNLEQALRWYETNYL